MSIPEIAVFSFLDSEMLIKMAQAAVLIERRQKEPILVQGEPVPGIYIVKEGLAGVFAATSSQPIAEISIGDSFGEMSFIDESVASATVRAMHPDTKVLLLRRSDLQALIAHDPVFGIALYRGLALVLSAKLRQTNNIIAAEFAEQRESLAALGDRADLNFRDFGSVQANVARSNEQVRSAAVQLEGLLETLSERMPEARLALSKVQTQASAIRHQFDHFYPRLELQLAKIGDFIGRIEKTLLRFD